MLAVIRLITIDAKYKKGLATISLKQPLLIIVLARILLTSFCTLISSSMLSRNASHTLLSVEAFTLSFSIRKVRGGSSLTSLLLGLLLP